MASIADADFLIDLAVKEGMAGFLYKSLLKSESLDMLNPSQKQRLYTTYYLTIRHNLKLIHALNEIINPLVQSQVQVVLMQGISLLLQIYPDIGLRPMKDMDLWVMPNQYPDLADCLISLGFERNTIYPNTFSKGEVLLDVRTHFLWADRIKSRDLLINVGQEEIFKNAQQINADNSAALCLNPDDQFLYLSLHALKHNLERLVWLVDIMNLIAKWGGADWNTLMARAEQLGQLATVRYILFILKSIFRYKLPFEISSILEGWKPSLFESRMLSRRIHGKPLPGWAKLLLISSGRGVCDRLSLLKEALFPRPAILRQVFSNSLNVSDRQLYWKRILQILGSFK